MEASTLVRMANQIAAYFAPYPKPEAIDGIVKHVHNFWEPRMRNQLKAYIDQGGEGLSPLFLEAAHEYFKGPKGTRAKSPASQSGTVNTGASPATSRGT